MRNLNRYATMQDYESDKERTSRFTDIALIDDTGQIIIDQFIGKSFADSSFSTAYPKESNPTIIY